MTEKISKLQRIREQIEKKYGDSVKVEMGESPIIENNPLKGYVEPILKEIDMFESGQHIKLTFENFGKCQAARLVFHEMIRIKGYNKLKLVTRKESLFIVKV